MKSTKDLRGKVATPNSGDSIRKAAKLAPIKKGSKERRVVYDDLDDDPSLYEYKKRDSILDYYDDSDNDDDDDDDDNYDDDETDEEYDDEEEV